MNSDFVVIYENYIYVHVYIPSPPPPKKKIRKYKCTLFRCFCVHSVIDGRPRDKDTSVLID